MLKVIHQSRYGDHPDNYHLNRKDNVLEVILTYPPYDKEKDTTKISYVEVALEHVRAGDGLRMYYDFARDGFVIEQPTTEYIKTSATSYESIEIWTEVGFFQSWALAKPEAEQFNKADLAYEEKQKLKK